MSILASYLADNDIPQRVFAARVNVDPSVMSRFVHHKARPSLEIAVAIERATDGAVPATSWIDEPKSEKGAT